MPTPMKALADRARGALVASAAGDALGAGYEFSRPGPRTQITMRGGGPFGFAPGEWTDDTSMANAVSLAAARKANLASVAALNDVAASFNRWHSSKPKDIGKQTRRVLSHRARTAAAMRTAAANITGRKGGNGSLMRTGPVGVACLLSADQCFEAAGAISDLTHFDPDARLACQLWSHAIRHATLFGTLDGVDDFLDRLTGMNRMTGLRWRGIVYEGRHGDPSSFPTNFSAVGALQTALRVIEQTDDGSPASLERGLVAAVREGGDTDTVAAITGSLLGARWGLSALPTIWLEQLHGYPGLGAEHLIGRADKIVARQNRGAALARLVQHGPDAVSSP